MAVPAGAQCCSLGLSPVRWCLHGCWKWKFIIRKKLILEVILSMPKFVGSQTIFGGQLKKFKRNEGDRAFHINVYPSRDAFHYRQKSLDSKPRWLDGLKFFRFDGENGDVAMQLIVYIIFVMPQEWQAMKPEPDFEGVKREVMYVESYLITMKEKYVAKN